jgi:hypothetical protein
MRTTIRLSDELLKEAKRAAADSGQTLTRLIEDSVREALARRKSTGRRERVSLPTFSGNGVRRGVDLYDSASMLDLMDRTSAPS